MHFSVKQSVEIKEAGKQESTNGGGNDTQPQNTSGGNETETGSSTIEGTSTQSTQGGLEGKVRDEHISEPEPNKRLNRLIIRRRSLLRKYARILRNLRRTSNLDNKICETSLLGAFGACVCSYPRILRMNKRFAKFGGKWSGPHYGMTKRERKILYSVSRKHQLLAFRLVKRLRAIRSGKAAGNERNVLLRLKEIFKNLTIPRIRRLNDASGGRGPNGNRGNPNPLSEKGQSTIAKPHCTVADFRTYSRIVRNIKRTSNLDKKTGKLFARRIRRIWKLYKRILKLNRKFKRFGGKWRRRFNGMTKKERKILYYLPRKKHRLALRLTAQVT